MTTSVEEAHGAAVGFSGHIHGFNADVEFRLAEMILKVGKWVEQESGMFLGHIKMALSCGDEGINLNLTDLDEGVLHHNTMMPKKKVDFHFMAAVTDVDAHELEHVMMHAIEDSGVDFCIEDQSATHHHDHDHEHGEDCDCGCHDHEHHHHHHEHGEDCDCGCHDHEHEHHHHEHDENCDCGCHDHEHHHHEHGEDCDCGCHDHDHEHHHEHKHHHEHDEDCKCGCHDHKHE